MSKIDPWEKAADCDRAIQISIDPHRKAVLINLQQMWIGLGNQREFLTQEELVPCHRGFDSLSRADLVSGLG
jgi:hypothetical protein